MWLWGCGECNSGGVCGDFIGCVVSTSRRVKSVGAGGAVVGGVAVVGVVVGLQ